MTKSHQFSSSISTCRIQWRLTISLLEIKNLSIKPFTDLLYSPNLKSVFPRSPSVTDSGVPHPQHILVLRREPLCPYPCDDSDERDRKGAGTPGGKRCLPAPSPAGSVNPVPVGADLGFARKRQDKRDMTEAQAANPALQGLGRNVNERNRPEVQMLFTPTKNDIFSRFP